MERNVCWGCGEPEGHEDDCPAEEHAAMLAGDEVAKAIHDPDECEACLADHTIKCQCRWESWSYCHLL
jgi:hypothetical protein